MKSQTLQALTEVNAYAEDDAAVRLYHATRFEHGDPIVEQLRLKPTAPEDPAMRATMPGQGFVYLASASSIGEDLPDAEVVLAVDVAVELLPEAPLRASYGEPPRVELEIPLPRDDFFPVLFADRLDRTITAGQLPAPVGDAIALFTASPFGQQLTVPGQDVGGWCEDASLRFLSALRHCSTTGTLLSWGAPRDLWFHHTVQVADGGVDIDWTARQFNDSAPCPRIETSAQAADRYTMRPSSLNPDSAWDRRFVRPVPPWPQAGERKYVQEDFS